MTSFVLERLSFCNFLFCCVIQQFVLSIFVEIVNVVHLLSNFIKILQKIFQKRVDIIQIHGIMFK